MIKVEKLERKRHNCNWDNDKDFGNNQSAYVDYCDVAKEWGLIVSDGMYESEIDVVVPIKFCPFCGEKLS